MGEDQYEALLMRIEKLEKRVSDVEKNCIPSSVDKVKVALRRTGVFNACIRRVPSDYYEKPLAYRALTLRSHVPHLCKSIILQNNMCRHDDTSDPTDSKYYCVVIQYAAKFNSEKMKEFIHKLRPSETRLPKKRFNFQLAPEEISDKLTGFKHNAVCPYGMDSPIPVVICDSILSLSPPFIWMGAGEVDAKLGLPVSDFLRSTNALVGSMSEPRDENELMST